LSDNSFSRSDFEFEIFEFGINKIKENLSNNKPVIISITKDILNKKTSGHMVVICGFEEDNMEVESFNIKDPENIDNKSISIEDFKEVWKKLAIFTN
jgi:hypothetical protein